MATIPQFVHTVTNVPNNTDRSCDNCASDDVNYVEWANSNGHVVMIAHICGHCGAEMDQVGR